MCKFASNCYDIVRKQYGVVRRGEAHNAAAEKRKEFDCVGPFILARENVIYIFECQNYNIKIEQTKEMKGKKA